MWAVNRLKRLRFGKPNFKALSRRGYMLFDMHVHTNVSDGTCSAEDILQKARELGIGVAFSDHDKATAAVRHFTNDYNVPVIPSIEVEANTGEHFLYYFHTPEDLDVFYNPIMKLNRDVSLELLNVLPNKNMQIALPLAASGVRGIRFLTELKKNKIKTVYFNDNMKNFEKKLIKNLKINKIKSKYEISNKDANIFLLEGKGYDYIDIDPSGNPSPFLSSAILRLARNGI